MKRLLIVLCAFFSISHAEEILTCINNMDNKTYIYPVDNSYNETLVLANISSTISHFAADVYAKMNAQQKWQCTVLEKTLEKLESNDDQFNKRLKEMHIILDELKGERQLSDSLLPTNCMEATKATHRSGIYEVVLPIYGPKPFNVACDEDTHYGGWTVVQRRIDGSVDFYRNWTEYKNGFGELRGEFFIGFDKLHAMTAGVRQELLIVMRTFAGSSFTAKYDAFVIGSETEGYTLKELGKYSGDADDQLRAHVGKKLSTKDVDNDDSLERNCANQFKGAWWFNKCYNSHLNGEYVNGTETEGVFWHGNIKANLKFAQMMIRPREELN